jgi:uracil permease
MSNDHHIVLDVHERPSPGLWLILSTQHLFAMFGATILVPYLTGLNPSVALISSGLGTLLYIVCTRGKIPAYLGSSFAFIGPIIAASQIEGIGAAGALVGCISAGLVYVIVAVMIHFFGVRWLMRLLPPVVVGPVIMVIGLGLASVAINMAMNDPATGQYSTLHFGIALTSLLITIVCSVFMRGVFALIPILFGVVGGYAISLSLGLIDFSKVAEAPLFAIPDFTFAFISEGSVLTLTAVALIAPVAFVTIAEHIGDQMVLSKVTGRNFLEEPGLHRSLLGDGLATALAAFIGGPPNTTYGENIGVIVITRVMSVFVVGGAACIAILFGFMGTVSALIQTIPVPVMGGVAILLFGIIASSGMRMMIDRRVDFGMKRNLIIASVILVIGIGGAFIQFSGDFKIAGMALATLVGLILNAILPGREKAEAGGSIFSQPDDIETEAAE